MGGRAGAHNEEDMMGIGYPKRGDVVYVVRGHERPRIGILLSISALLTRAWYHGYEVLVGLDKWRVTCMDVFLTFEDANSERNKRYCDSFGPPSFESDFGQDPNWKEKREIEEHKRRHEGP